MRPPRAALLAIAILAMSLGRVQAAARSGPVEAVGIENEYADVIAQIGGAAVRVSAVETDPNTDPHSFEISPRIVARFASAELIVENGLGYDSWVDRIIAATPNPLRKVIVAQRVLGLPERTPNPHLWYDPKTMPAVAKAIADDLSALRPDQTASFRTNLAKFDASLKPWLDAIASFKTKYDHTPVAVTEPVANYLLLEAGCDIATPPGLQAAIMNGTDPSPQDVTMQDRLLTGRKVKAFIYNRQVTDTLTQSFLALAKKNGIPVIGVYETMPTPGFDYQSWMLAEMEALRRAVADHVSTERLEPEHR